MSSPAAVRSRRQRSAELKASTWGENKDFGTWDDPVVADLAWGSRKLELEVRRAVAGGLGREAAERAVRELLAVQSSDWAFLDKRGQAGDYAFQRATDHARAMLEAIDSPYDTDPRMRSIAPDVSLAPLLEP